jgi:8-oxo-dGTP pyrophosphatase MutT (NUDIX family)
VFQSTLVAVESALARPLPGIEAQLMLAPRPRRNWPADFNMARIRHAAGLILLFPIDDEPHLVLTVRADTLRHAGQVSLPGGVIEPGESYDQAALREAHEEIGLLPSAVRVLGALTSLDIPVSGFRLHPVVATTPERPALEASDEEVARILEVPLLTLMDPTCLVESERQRDGRLLTIPAFRVCGEEIWGATAMILAELLALLGWRRPGPERSPR